MPKLTFLRRTASVRMAVTAAVLATVAITGQAAFSSSSNGYVVQPGDTLWAIAQRAGVSMQSLAAANSMQLTDVLSVGRHLVIPGFEAKEAASQPASAPVANAAVRSYSSGTTGSTFCSSFAPTTGPWGVLPSVLQQNPSRLALRPLFREWGGAYGVNPSLLEAIAWQESGWQQGVVSPAQAVGVGQLLPATADFVSRYLIGQRLDINSAYDNIRMMARFVAYLQTQVRGTCNVIAAYYEGTQNLTTYGVLVETQPYVANVEYLLPMFS
ncbi:LysM peptidoglycan-binding domain-containing protein [Acidiferrimicrobium sp. IK]|uniref:LysM peptidoglycan-binding domain-containing protein n=1 Tax=Acidiferrimicrobium sp. IK TaxID=2871700 RepID=UPI0021CB92B1|nr:LysM peptidoglycan-binding domain-containing protein [Acidiferrimicrobium sp. IK]MCU4184676.1 LysM peptidoglycan-binding domain-containing protein [Acidiferrimicrobium sp. IK]